jgi:hypothetical protein
MKISKNLLLSAPISKFQFTFCVFWGRKATRPTLLLLEEAESSKVASKHRHGSSRGAALDFESISKLAQLFEQYYRIIIEICSKGFILRISKL